MISEVVKVLSSALIYTICFQIIIGIKIRIKPIGLAINSWWVRNVFIFFFCRISYCAAVTCQNWSQQYNSFFVRDSPSLPLESKTAAINSLEILIVVILVGSNIGVLHSRVARRRIYLWGLDGGDANWVGRRELRFTREGRGVYYIIYCAAVVRE